MSYLYLTTCDACGHTTKPAKTKSEALFRAESTGWVFVRHMGQHFCSKCRAAKEAELAKPKVPPRPTREQRSAEARARRIEREQVAVRLRKAGSSWSAIGAALGVSGTRAAQLHESATTRKGGDKKEESFGVTPAPDMQESVKILNLSVRSLVVLEQGGVKTIGQLSQLSQNQVLNLPNIGRKSYNEIIERLGEIGISLPERNY
jgi:hypothetical protein